MVVNETEKTDSGHTPTLATSVDPAEIARFEKIAATWWDEQGPFWPLHRLNRLRTDWLVAHIATALGRDPQAQHPLAGLRILDVGCGGGILSESMARQGADVLGIDVTTRNIAIAEQHALGQNLSVRYMAMPLEALPIEQGFDIVLNMEVIEHVTDPQTFLALCLRQVNPGGFLALATLNRTVLSYIAGIWGAEFIFRILPKGTHQWRRFVKPHELTEPLHDAGFTLIARSGVAVNPITRSMRLMRYEGINYMLLARAPQNLM